MSTEQNWIPRNENVYPYKKSRFVDDDIEFKGCNHIQHNPPSHMVIPYGKKYIHVCPACGRTVTLSRPIVSM